MKSLKSSFFLLQRSIFLVLTTIPINVTLPMPADYVEPSSVQIGQLEVVFEVRNKD